jgi:hypothetical protein
LTVNAGMAALRDLTDPLSTFLVCGLLVGWLTEASWLSLGLWAVGAVLCREQNVLILAILLVGAVWQRRWWTGAALVLALLLWAGWIGTVWAIYSDWPFHRDGPFALPLVGLVRGVAQVAEMSSRKWLFAHLLGLFILYLEVGAVIWLLSCRLDPVLRAILVLGVGWLLVGGAAIYDDLYSVQRVFVLLPLGVWLACIQLRRPRILVPLAAPALILLAVVVQAWFKQGV